MNLLCSSYQDNAYNEEKCKRIQCIKIQLSKHIEKMCYYNMHTFVNTLKNDIQGLI